MRQISLVTGTVAARHRYKPTPKKRKVLVALEAAVIVTARLVLFAALALAAAGCAGTNWSPLTGNWQDLRLERGASCRRPCASSMELWRP